MLTTWPQFFALNGASRVLVIATLSYFFMSCERSSKGVQVQPPVTQNSANGPQDSGSEGEDGQDGTATKKTGKVKISVTGAAASAKEMNLSWNLNGKSDNIIISLTGGSGSTVLNYIPIGSGEITFSGDIDGKSFPESAQSVTVSSTKTQEVTLEVKAGQPAPQQQGGNTDIEIIPQIGGLTPNNGQQPASWDGKSFQGNDKWSITPIP
jgi:hypothetical protein